MSFRYAQDDKIYKPHYLKAKTVINPDGSHPGAWG